ncbi:hydrogenase expression/formation protein HupK [Primorskyibacter sp. 2E233]|uniref:hydrogenase expression/formation protein HupK n=1 Tax=Primorskyibacter sp. 2E233 TaxID=3413431 RepID=UPI003BF14414
MLVSALPLTAVAAPPLPVARLVQGRPTAEVAELLPRLFNLCRAAQGAAIRMALGDDFDAADLPREIARDHLMRLGVILPARLGLHSLPISDGASALWAERCPQTMPELRALMASDTGLGPVLRRLAQCFAPGEACADLPPVTEWNALREGAVENSPAVRHLGHPLLLALEAEYGRGPLWRVFARMLDLDACLRAALPAPRGIGPGAAMVPAARGVYAIAVSTIAGRVSDLTRVTPTDHLMAKDGIMAQSLATLRAENHSLVPLLVDILDPCCKIEITGGPEHA